MAYYLIAAGGTGAKCLNAFVHLCAAGLMPGYTADQSVQIYLVDADVTNGNRSVTLNALDHYQKAHEGLEKMGAKLGNNCPLFKTPLVYKAEDNKYNWNPLPNNNYTLDQILQIRTLPKEYQELYHVLYPQEKRESTFQNGFLGWPSVGSAIISSVFEELKHLTQKIAADPNAKVLLMGSIFGGTGAASIPTLAKLLSKSFESKAAETPDRQNRSLGMVLLLPYFMFDSQQGQTGDHLNNPNIEPLNFALKTKIALQYYYSHGMHEICDRIYLLGDSHLNKVADSKQIGGQKQKNKPHYMELYAALACIDFFGHTPVRPGTAAKEPVYQETCRRQDSLISWADLPYAERDWQQIYDKLHRMTSTAFIYNASFMPLFRDLRAQAQKSPAQFPWYVHLMEEAKVNLAEAQPTLKAVYEYFYNYLDWLRLLHQPMEGDPHPVEVNLFNRKSLEHYFAQDRNEPKASLETLSAPAYVNLTVHANSAKEPPKGGLFRTTGFDLVRKNMNKFKLEDSAKAQHLGVFLNALYHCSL